MGFAAVGLFSEGILLQRLPAYKKFAIICVNSRLEISYHTLKCCPALK